MKIEGQICPSRYIVMDQADRDLFDVINRENFCGIRWCVSLPSPCLRLLLRALSTALSRCAGTAMSTYDLAF